MTAAERPGLAPPDPRITPGRDPILDAINLLEIEALARARLDPSAYDYFAGGAHDEITLRSNRAAFDRLSIAYRVLVDVSQRNLATSILGERVAMPVLVAPTAFQGMAHPDAELATARAAGRAGTVMILSSLANTAVEEVVRASAGPVWFQLYVYRDRAATRAVVERAEAAGCRAVVLTVDAPVLGTRERDAHNRFHLPDGLSAVNLVPHGYGAVTHASTGSGLTSYFAQLIDPSLSWKDVDWLASICRIPVILKGLVRADDARRALDHGVAGIVVSNHGGRQLDTALPSISALPAVADAVGRRAPILMDGGVRRGTDVLKALALGASAVLLGRPILWGLATSGEQGVDRVLHLLRAELDVAMALAGCASVDQISRELVC